MIDFVYLMIYSGEKNLNRLQKKMFSFVAAVKCLGQVIAKDRIRPFLNKLEAIQKKNSPDARKSFETDRSFQKLFKKFSKHARNLSSVVGIFRWWRLLAFGEEHRVSEANIVAKVRIDIINYRKSNFLVDFSANGEGTVLVEADDKEQMQVISDKSRSFTESEQENAVIFR